MKKPVKRTALFHQVSVRKIVKLNDTLVMKLAPKKAMTVAGAVVLIPDSTTVELVDAR